MRDSRETDEVLVCMAQRLQAQVERQLTVVERLHAAGTEDTLADLAELRTTLQLSLRGCDNLLVLGGAQQGPRSRGGRGVADVLAEARAGVEDTARVGLGPAPDAEVAPRAVPALVALFSELFTHALTVSAGDAPVDVTSRRAEDGGLIVEVACDATGPTPGELDELNRRLTDRPIIDDIVSNRVGLFVAARIAARVGVSIRLAPLSRAVRAHGHVAVVHCPSALLDSAGAAAAPTWTATVTPARNGAMNGSHNGNGRGNGAERARPEPVPDAARPPVDELFGPLTSAQRDSMRDAGPTPIYEAVASAWFVDPDGAAPEWDTPQDTEWREASARAARPVPEDAPATAAGLPRRRPGTQMVAPPRRGAPTPPNGSPPNGTRGREPDRVRERLAVYQQGLARGRHRAGDDGGSGRVDTDPFP